jgi:hypothetical protein
MQILIDEQANYSGLLWHPECIVLTQDRNKFWFFGGTMRSDLVFQAMTHVPNRFLLAKILARASRGFHKPGTRIEDTTNAVLVRFGNANPIADEHFIRVSTSASRCHSRPQPAARRKNQFLTVPAVPEMPHALSEAFAS